MIAAMYLDELYMRCNRRHLGVNLRRNACACRPLDQQRRYGDFCKARHAVDAVALRIDVAVKLVTPAPVFRLAARVARNMPNHIGWC